MTDQPIQELHHIGVAVRSLPEPVLRELDKVAQSVLEEQAASDEPFRRVLESQRRFADDYREWKRVAFLPRDF